MRAVGGLLEKQGIPFTVLDLVNMRGHYNPFAYLRRDSDALRLVTNLVANTTPKDAKNSDPFWDRAETALLQALILYLKHRAPVCEQNFTMVMEMINAAEVREGDPNFKSALDLLFDELESEEPQSIALKQYKVFKQAQDKTAKSILIGAAVRLAAFNLPELARVTDSDEMYIGRLGEEKRAIFCVIPDNDTSLNFLVSMLYTQAFQELYYIADQKYGGPLPVHVQCIQDEWANTPQPDNYLQILRTARSRNIGCSVVVQGLSAIKAMYKESWEEVVGNCDSFLFLGGNDQESLSYISKMTGKATIDTITRGETKGARRLIQPELPEYGPGACDAGGAAHGGPGRAAAHPRRMPGDGSEVRLEPASEYPVHGNGRCAAIQSAGGFTAHCPPVFRQRMYRKNGKTGIIGDTDQYGCWVGDNSSPVDLYAYTSNCRVGGIAGGKQWKNYMDMERVTIRKQTELYIFGHIVEVTV